MTHLEPCACGGVAEIYVGVGWTVYCARGICNASTLAYSTEAEAISVWNTPALLAKAEAENARLRKALEFYADPETYHAVELLVDRPCGLINEDYSDDHGHWLYERPMLGKRARAALGDTP